MKKGYLLCACLALLTACSPYQRDFRKAEVPKEGVEGPWVGEWKSEVNGHHGPLWCLVTEDAVEKGTWHFRYRAGWGVLKFGDYTHRFQAARAGEDLPIDAEMELPGGWGTFRVKGRLTAERFEARFESEDDRGTMNLRRPVRGEQKKGE